MLAYLKPKLEDWNVEGGIWLNEFGPYPADTLYDQAERDAQLWETQVMFEADDDVARYAVWTLRAGGTWWPYGDNVNCFECDSRTLTSYGETYRDVNYGESHYLAIVLRQYP